MDILVAKPLGNGGYWIGTDKPKRVKSAKSGNNFPVYKYK